MSRIRGEEEWARQCLAAALRGARVKRHDDGSSTGMFDLEILYEDGRRGAVEVTAAADSESIELWNLLNGDDGRWIEPDLKGGWIVALYPSARAKRIKVELPRLLKQLEREGVREVRTLVGRSGLLEEAAAQLGISHLLQSGTEYPGSIYPTIELPDEKSGGVVAETGDALAKWLSRWITEPEQEHNLRKLRAADASERHLFVILPGFADASFQVTDLLMRDGAPLPTIPPTLPGEVSHVWCMRTWNSGEGMRWSPTEGWRRFDDKDSSRQ